MARHLTSIACDIVMDLEKNDPKSRKYDKIVPHAAPYIKAMMTLERLSDSYFADSGASVVAYALSNLGTWKGEKAKKIKAELNDMLKGVKHG